jgi:hypothetical protein
MTLSFITSLRSRFAVAALAGLASAGILVGGTTASAAGVAPAFSTARTAATSSKPTSDIEGMGKNLSFHPSSLHATWSGSSPSNCTAQKVSFVIANDTSASQKLTLDGKLLGTLPSGAAVGICAFGSGTQTAVFSTKADPKAKLAVHLS